MFTNKNLDLLEKLQEALDNMRGMVHTETMDKDKRIVELQQRVADLVAENEKLKSSVSDKLLARAKDAARRMNAMESQTGNDQKAVAQIINELIKALEAKS